MYASVYNTWIEALIVGLIVVSVPFLHVAKNSGQAITRHTLVIAHVLMIALHVQQLNGQIEAHFGFFVMTGMFFIYRDWKLVF